MAIQAKDLRIGNWVSGSNDPEMIVVSIGEIIELRFDGVDKDYGDWAYDESDVKPITLTEEWLLKFDFKKVKLLDLDPSFSKHYEYRIDDIDETHMTTFEIDHFNEAIFLYNGEHDIKLEHVHQLQNLYFALTGEELKLNP